MDALPKAATWATHSILDLRQKDHVGVYIPDDNRYLGCVTAWTSPWPHWQAAL